MSARRHRDEGGQVLLLALIFVLVFGVLISLVLALVRVNLDTTTMVRSRTARSYATDGAIEYTIERLKIDPTLCATEAATALPPQVVNGRTATISCQITPGSGFPLGAQGWAAIITGDLGKQAGGTAHFNGPVYVRGAIANGQITNTDGSVYQYSPTCPGSLTKPSGLTVTPNPPYSWQCTTQPTPDPPHVLPPVPGSPKAADTYGSCRVFYPGTYTAAPALLANNYFVSGVYYFKDIGAWSIPNHTTLVGGSNPDDPNPITTPCKADADGEPGGGGTGFGVQWIFGGNSRLATGNGVTIELHARVPGPAETTTTKRVSFVAVPTSGNGYLASTPPSGLVFDASGGHPALSIFGLYYGPTTDVDLDGPNGSSVFRGGAVINDVHLKLSAAISADPIFTVGTSGTTKRYVQVTATSTDAKGTPVVSKAVLEIRESTDPPTIVVHSWRTR